jgi:hypothetical protein
VTGRFARFTTSQPHSIDMRRLLPTLLLASLAACGGGDPAQAGYDALGSGDYEAAASSFTKALAGTQGAQRTDLTLQLCQALAHTDAGACVAKMKELDAATELRVQDYNVVVSELMSAGAYVPATDVLKLATSAFPGDEKLVALIQKVGDAAASAGDGDALSALKGLGYVGND